MPRAWYPVACALVIAAIGQVASFNGPSPQSLDSAATKSLVRSGEYSPSAQPQPQEFPLVTLIAASAEGSAALAWDRETGGFFYINLESGQAKLISPIPYTGHFATLSPDGRYVCFKDFQRSERGWLSFPALYDLVDDTAIPLSAPTETSGNPAMSSTGLVAFTTEDQLILQMPSGPVLSRFTLGFVANHIAFSEDSQTLLLTDESETLWELNLRDDTARPVRLAAGFGFRPESSPGGRFICAQKPNGSIDVLDRLTGTVRRVGIGTDPHWLDDSTVYFRVSGDDLNSESTQTTWVGISVAATRQDRVVFEDSAVRTSSVGRGNIFLEASRFGIRRGTILSSGVQRAPRVVSAEAVTRGAPLRLEDSLYSTDVFSPQDVVVPGAVPYVHQVLDRDTTGGFTGQSSCGPTSALMAILYYSQLPAAAPAAWYVSNQYSSHGITYSYQAVAQ